jgi:hypothetical protein
MAPYGVVRQWQDMVFTESDGEGLQVIGPTAEAIADTLIALVRSHRSSVPFVPATAVECEQSPLRCFFNRWHDIQMQVHHLSTIC